MILRFETLAGLRHQDVAPSICHNFIMCGLRAQRSAIGGMIRVAFDMDHLRRDVLRPVTNRVDKDATTHPAIGTSGPRFVARAIFNSLSWA